MALDPNRYVDQEVTVVGRFRGRNLYGDLPDAPGKSRWDFVIQSADAAVWVTGRRPRGDGFDLNIDNRVDTGRWLEVAGQVKFDRGLVRLEATSIRPGQPPAQSAPEALVKMPVHVPPPEVVFSAPTNDETDVEPTASIRIQFSRDLRAGLDQGPRDRRLRGLDPAASRRSRRRTTAAVVCSRSSSPRRSNRSRTVQVASRKASSAPTVSR